MRQAPLLAVWACAGVLLGRTAGATGTTGAGTQTDVDEVHVEADAASMRGRRETGTGPDIQADGHVHVTRHGLQLRAPHLEVFKGPRYGIMDGGAVGADGLVILFAQRLHFTLQTRTLALEDGLIIEKKGTTTEALLAGLNSDNPGCIRKTGTNALTMKAGYIRRNPDESLDAWDDVWFTTCACSDRCTPLMALSASRAHIVPNERASFVAPVVRLFDWPSLPLPWISMPLTSRATGLLFPLVGFSGPGGINIAVPVFITLGDSADLTIQGLYYFGNPTQTPSPQSVLGPGDDVELRWRPAVDSVGSLHVLHVFDTTKNEFGPGLRGNRGEIQLNHSQGLLGGHAGLSFNAVTDSDVVADTSISPVVGDESYLRSWAEYSRVAGPLEFSLDSNYLEDLQSQPCAVYQGCFPRTPWSAIPGAVTPVARATVGASGGLGRLAASEELSASFEDAWAFQPTPSTPHTRRLVTGIALAQTLPLARGRGGILAVESGERIQDLVPADAGESGDLRWRAGGYVGLLAQTTLARTFTGGWVHDIVPSIRIRGLGAIGNVKYSQGLFADQFAERELRPFTSGTRLASLADGLVRLTSPLPQDEADLALPPEPTVQSLISVVTHLTPPGAPPLSLALEQHLALLPFDSGQFRASLSVPLGLNTITASGGRAFSLGSDFGWTPASVAYKRLVPSVGDFQVSGSYANLRSDDQIGRGADLLFTPRFEVPPVPSAGPPLVSEGLAAVVNLTHLGPVVVQLKGGLSYYPRESPNPAPTSLVQDYTAAVYYEAEGCGRISFTLHWTHVSGQPFALPVPTPVYQFSNSQDISRGAQSVFGPGT
jgi:hypothetical protein